MLVKKIEKWYKELKFDKKYDEAFYDLVKRRAENFDMEFGDDGESNLLLCLYKCEALWQKYQYIGISYDIFLDTMADIVRWTEVWTKINNKLSFNEVSWINLHFDLKLYKLGRLQFEMAKSRYSSPEDNLYMDDNVLKIHIPREGALDNAACIESIRMAGEFFKKYFPKFKYEKIICSSWLLDPTLSEHLGENSNIIKFQKLFKNIDAEKSTVIFKFVYSWDTEEKNIPNLVPFNDFSSKIKDAYLRGKDFYSGVGIIKSEYM